MTRFLSESLQATEPFFRLGLRRLEAAHGNPAADIRFTTDILHAAQAKLRALALDPRDTTPQELYHALQQRIAADDALLTKYVRTQAATYVSAEADPVAGIAHVLKQLPDSRRCYALKNSALKALLKKTPPRKALKQLGYRSLDSSLKHETPVLVLTAAWLSEGENWQKRFLEQYKKLTPADFESRSIQILHPRSERWQKLAQTVVARARHNLISFKEVGVLVFLPLPAEVPAGGVTASLSLALHELNEIRAASTFLKLHQVRSGFGDVVKRIATDEPQLASKLLDRPVPWHLIHRYYAQLTNRFREEIFEPHLEKEDMAWHSAEDTLAAIVPSFDFWRQGAHLGWWQAKQLVSLNVIDAALNYCNQLPFEGRVAHYFRRSLWHELMLRYLRHEPVERIVQAELQPELATETVLA